MHILITACLCSADAMDMKKSAPVKGSLAGTAVLPCHFPPTTNQTSATDQLRIVWTKVESNSRKVVLSQNGSDRNSTWWAYVPSNSKETGDASLNIRRLRTSDAGIYHCEVTSGTERTQATVSLDVSGEC